MSTQQSNHPEDKEIADVLNDIELLQLKPYNEKNDVNMQELVESIATFSRIYHNRVRAHAGEIQEVLSGMAQWYTDSRKPVPIAYVGMESSFS